MVSFLTVLLTGSDITPQCLVIILLYAEKVKSPLLSLNFISVDLQTRSIAARLPLMTAFADLFEVAPPSLQYHRASGKRGRNPCGTFSTAMQMLLFC